MFFIIPIRRLIEIKISILFELSLANAKLESASQCPEVTELLHLIGNGLFCNVLNAF